jgi:hypothetical protein
MYKTDLNYQKLRAKTQFYIKTEGLQCKTKSLGPRVPKLKSLGFKLQETGPIRKVLNTWKDIYVNLRTVRAFLQNPL